VVIRFEIRFYYIQKPDFNVTLGQLKVNLRPIWAASVTTIATIHGRFPTIVSLSYLDSLTRAEKHQSDANFDSPDWGGDALDASIEEGRDAWHEEERSWRDGNGHTVEKVKRLFGCFNSFTNGKKHIAKDQVIRERLDLSSFNLQLVAVLVECPSLLDQHPDAVLPLFLDFSAVPTAARGKLSTWLKALSKWHFSKQALPFSKSAYGRFLKYLSFPDLSIQTPALDCVLNFTRQFGRRLEGSDQLPDLLPNEITSLNNLLIEKLWKDELVNFKERSDIPLDQENSHFNGLLVRILYGILRDRRRGGGSGKAADLRRACLRLLEVACGGKELTMLTSLMLESFSLELSSSGTSNQGFHVKALTPTVTDRQAMGFLMLLEDVLKILGRALIESDREPWRLLLCTTITITATASERMAKSTPCLVEDGSRVENSENEDPELPGTSDSHSRLNRSLRQTGIKRLTDFSRLSESLDLKPYISPIFKSIISPRMIEAFPFENAQSPSALLELFVAWAANPLYREYLVSFDDRLLPLLINCLGVPGVKSPVVNRIFDIIENLTEPSEIPCAEKTGLFDPFVVHTLNEFSKLMQTNSAYLEGSDHTGKRALTLLVRLSPLARSVVQARRLMEIFLPVLRKPSKSVSEKSKAEILGIYVALISQLTIEDISQAVNNQSSTAEAVYQAFGTCFQSLRSREARIRLVGAFRSLCKLDETRWGLVCDIITDLNSFSEKRSDEPDFDRRLKAFARLNDVLYKNLGVSDWPPVLYNMLHFIQDTEELSLRVNASATMKRFINHLAANSQSPQLLTVFNKVLLTGIKNGLRTKSDTVRAELLSVYHHAVISCTEIKSLNELKILLVQGDEEADFFNNINHIQLHRRTRALRRLSEVVDRGEIRSSTLGEIFIPLVGNFIQNPRNVDPSLATEAISALGHMAKQLTWPLYYSLVQTYMKLVRSGGENERVHVRALVTILDSFHFALDEETSEIDSDDSDVDEIQEDSGSTSEKKRIAEIVNTKLLPSLINHLGQRGEIEDNLRVPISTGIVRIALHLPGNIREGQINRLLTVLSQILR